MIADRTLSQLPADDLLRSAGVLSVCLQLLIQTPNIWHRDQSGQSSEPDNNSDKDISLANYFGQLRKKTTMVHKIDVFWYTSIQNAENADRSPDLNSILFSCNQRGLDLFFIKGAAPDSINFELQWSPLELGCTRICTYTSFAIAEISVRKWLYKESKQMVQHYSILVIDEEIVDTVKS